MELFHVHLLDNNDRLYYEGSEFIVDPKKFNNRLYNRIYNANVTIGKEEYGDVIDTINNELRKYGAPILGDRMNLGEVISYYLIKGVSKEVENKILNDAAKMLLATGTNNREMAMEEYRRDNCPELPSRLHSLFACSYEGVEFWASQLHDGPSDIYLIDVMDEPFVSNEGLIPYEGLPYGTKVSSSYKYFHPKKKDLNGYTDEYLIQGKVKILQKVGEVR